MGGWWLAPGLGAEKGREEAWGWPELLLPPPASKPVASLGPQPAHLHQLACDLSLGARLWSSTWRLLSAHPDGSPWDPLRLLLTVPGAKGAHPQHCQESSWGSRSWWKEVLGLPPLALGLQASQALAGASHHPGQGPFLPWRNRGYRVLRGGVGIAVSWAGGQVGCRWLLTALLPAWLARLQLPPSFWEGLG